MTGNPDLLEQPPSSAFDYEFSSECVLIDPFKCDLNLIVDKECLLAYSLASEGFCAMWAGCRASYGASSFKTAFEVHVSIQFQMCNWLIIN